jgi:hypothetical protein
MAMHIEGSVGLRATVIIFALLGIVSCGGSTPPQSKPLPNSASSATPQSDSGISPNQMGINIAAPLDYELDRLYADAILTSRKFTAGTNENGATDAQIDPTDKWPTEDFSFYVWGSGAKKNGTYALSFRGKANVSRNPGAAIPTNYDAATNTSTGTFSIPLSAESSTLALKFANTQRTETSATGTGVTSVKLMRPLTPGATQAYPTSALFTNPIKALIAKFSVIRFMDYLATNSNQQKDWTDRPLPTWPSFNRYSKTNGYGWQGIGGCWEHVILLANETGKNVWINIPVKATDAYVTNVANMLKYGSDGVNPYTSVQSNPVYPPLNPNLKIYVEYSNEIWNGASAFSQSYSACQLASDELIASSGAHPINLDSIWNGVAFDPALPNNWNWYFTFRYIGKRGVDISNLFRAVYGDAAMGTKIRPVLMTQFGASTRVLGQVVKMMYGYYDNLDGNFVATPHPPNYYFYGAGGSAYYGASSTVSLDAFFAAPGITPAGFTPSLQADEKMVAAMGLKRVAYEGGPSLDTSGNSALDAISAQAVNDPRMTSAIVAMHNAWSSNGGDLLVYYRATGDYQWGFTGDIYNLATPKLQAIDLLNSTPSAAPSFGTLVPGSVAGTAGETCARAWGCNSNAFGTTGTNPLNWAGYTFRSTKAGNWKVNISFTAANNASVAVYVDGTLVGTQSTTGSPLLFDAGSVEAGIHGVIARVVSGTFSINTVEVAQND